MFNICLNNHKKNILSDISEKIGKFRTKYFKMQSSVFAKDIGKQLFEMYLKTENETRKEVRTMKNGSDFQKGDIVQAKKEYLAPYETQESTMGIVVDYNADNDYLQVGVLNPQDYIFPPIFNGRGCYYEVVKRNNNK